jgi:hypothetical protein
MRLAWMSAASDNNLAWAKQYVDVARADVEAGNVVLAVDVITRLRSRPAN